MLLHIVHTSGSSIYFVLAILFIWLSQTPRARAGAGWWALALTCALIARITIPLTEPLEDTWFTLIAYSLFNSFEKVLLLVGVIRFCGISIQTKWLWATWGALILLGISAWQYGISIWVYRAGFAAFNIGCLVGISLVAIKHRSILPKSMMSAASLFSGLLSVHWVLAYPLIELYAAWEIWAYVLGTVLNLVLYLALLTGLLLCIQNLLLESEERALNLAYEDPLTGLKNKRYMSSLFDQVVMLANRPHQLMAIIYIDLDNFKPINDRAGHLVGDEILRIVADRLNQSTRSTDVCVRVGGDEFIVIATQLDSAEMASKISDKLLRVLIEPIIVKDDEYRLGASIGVSLYPSDGHELKELVDKADKAMYEVKRSGKNGFRLHQSYQAKDQLIGAMQQ